MIFLNSGLCFDAVHTVYLNVNLGRSLKLFGDLQGLAAPTCVTVTVMCCLSCSHLNAVQVVFKLKHVFHV